MAQINKQSLKELFDLSKNDLNILEMVQQSLDAFAKYHAAIFEMETWDKLHGFEEDEYQDTLESFDHTRTTCHNSVIAYINNLNGIAEQNGISPIYDGMVSEIFPFRRKLADAVLAYVEDVVKERR